MFKKYVLLVLVFGSGSLMAAKGEGKKPKTPKVFRRKTFEEVFFADMGELLEVAKKNHDEFNKVLDEIEKTANGADFTDKLKTQVSDEYSVSLDKKHPKAELLDAIQKSYMTDMLDDDVKNYIVTQHACKSVLLKYGIIVGIPIVALFGIAQAYTVYKCYTMPSPSLIEDNGDLDNVLREERARKENRN